MVQTLEQMQVPKWDWNRGFILKEQFILVEFYRIDRDMIYDKLYVWNSVPFSN